MIEPWLRKVAEDGFTVVRDVFTGSQVDVMLAALEQSFRQEPEAGPLRNTAGAIYAARNVLALWPEAATVWRQCPLPEIIAALLGAQAGLVRALYFDKPPERTWALPWHKDMTIAVRDNRLPSGAFSKPTVKAGVPHVEAPRAVLERMLTLRIHLDDVTEENGPLRVMPGSHLTEKAHGDGSAPMAILVERGDVLVMRPCCHTPAIIPFPERSGTGASSTSSSPARRSCRMGMSGTNFIRLFPYQGADFFSRSDINSDRATSRRRCYT